MNQILQTTNNKKRKSGEPIAIKSIVKFFAIIIMVFGLILAGQGVYAMINSNKEKAEAQEPEVNINTQDDYIVIHVKHNKVIDKITYSWNESEEYMLQGRGREEITEAIDLPTGNNTLTVTIFDSKGNKKTYQKEFVQSTNDTTKPQIEFVIEGNNIKVMAKDETEIAYMTYKWNNKEEVKIEANVDSPKQIEEKISVAEGQSTLTITAVDKAGNTTTEIQEVKGATKPVVSVVREGAFLRIKVSDSEGVKKLEYTLNGVNYSTGDVLNQKEFEYKQPIQPGEVRILIKAYNTSGLVTEVDARCDYQP